MQPCSRSGKRANNIYKHKLFLWLQINIITSRKHYHNCSNSQMLSGSTATCFMLTSVYAEQPEHSVRYSNVCVTEQQDHKQNCIAGGVGGGVDSF